MRYLDDSSDWTFGLRRVTSTPKFLLSKFVPNASPIEELMVAWIKSFENSLQIVLDEEQTENQSYLKTQTSPPRFSTGQNLQETLAHSEHEKTHTKRLQFLLRLSNMGLHSL